MPETICKTISIWNAIRNAGPLWTLFTISIRLLVQQFRETKPYPLLSSHGEHEAGIAVPDQMVLPRHGFGGKPGGQLDQRAAWIELKCSWMVLTRERAAAYISRAFTYS